MISKIIDVHAHLGEDVVFDEEQTEKELETAYLKYDVSGAIVQPYLPRIYIEEHKKIHDRIYNLTKSKGPVKYWGMASINPHFTKTDYLFEAERCIKELDFVGLKITPIGHATHPSSKDAMVVWEICRDFDIPLMIHTGNGVPFSDPISVEPALEKFPKVKCVLAHAGSEMHNQQAIYLARKFENVFLEPSWVGVIGCSNMLKAIGASRILYSSDNIHQIPVELAKYKSIVKKEEDLNKILGLNAINLYNLKDI